MTPIRRLWLQLKHCVSPFREPKRPSFPVDERLTLVRGSVDSVKPLIRRKPQHVSSWPVDGNGSPV
jgi:hypothetical protein